MRLPSTVAAAAAASGVNYLKKLAKQTLLLLLPTLEI